MKVRELRELLSEFDQDAEVKINIFDGDSLDGDRLLEVTDLDTNGNDDVVLEVE